MQVAILSARSGWHTDELQRALAERGHTCRLLPYEGLVARFPRVRPAGASRDVGDDERAGGHDTSGAPGEPRRHDTRRQSSARDLSSDGSSLLDADAVLARIIPAGSLDQIIFRVDALHWLERRGVTVVNSARTIERCVDKFYTDALLRDAGLPTPETRVCERADEAMAAVRELGEVIIKPIFGSMGHGLVRVSDPDVAWRVIRPLEQSRAVFYVQRVVDHGGRDVRVFVVGQRVLAAIERQAVNGDWRSNVSRGALVRPVDLQAGWSALALRAAAAVGADYAGVDLLPSSEGPFVLEVNGIPGWQGLQGATRVDVAAAIVDHVVARVSGQDGAAASSAADQPQ